MYPHRATLYCAAAIIALGTVSPAIAKNYDIKIENTSVAAVPVDQPNPSFAGEGVRRGQEGWVLINFVVTPDGRAVDPIVVDSSGGHQFEESARAVLDQWLFEAPGEERANNTAEIRFEIPRSRDRASSDFMRRYRLIVTNLFYEDVEKARARVDQALEIGGWNLYESTMLWLMVGRVEGAEDNATGKLETYRRALGTSNRISLGVDDRKDLLIKLFKLEIEHAQYAAATETFRMLEDEPGSQNTVESLQDKIAEMERSLAAAEPIVARATVFNPCNSEEGKPLWTYVPVRRTFSFAALSGNVERFEVRCERDRLQGLVEAGKTWSLPASAGSCQVFVFGDDGASFEFVEHSETESVDATDQTAVARSNVLD